MAIQQTPKKNNIKTEHILLLSVSCITILEIIAMLKGFTGTMFSLSLSAITGISGYLLKHTKEN